MSSRTPNQTTNIKAEMKLLTMLAIALLISHEARATPSAADYQRCGLIYGALFKAARDFQHKGMIEYTQPRLGAVMPFLEANKDNPDAAASFKTVAQQTLPVVKALENNC